MAFAGYCHKFDIFYIKCKLFLTVFLFIHIMRITKIRCFGYEVAFSLKQGVLNVIFKIEKKLKISRFIV